MYTGTELYPRLQRPLDMTEYEMRNIHLLNFLPGRGIPRILHHPSPVPHHRQRDNLFAPIARQPAVNHPA